MLDQAIDISNLSKAAVLAGLYNAAAPQGLGFFPATVSPGEMTVDEAQVIIDSGQLAFDYLNGRPFKVDLSGSSFDPWLYDRDNGGDGTAERIIQQVRDTGAVTSEATKTNHEGMTAQHAYESPVNELIAEVIANATSMWLEIVADGIPEPRDGMTPRQHLDWASDQALAYYDQGSPEKAIMLFLGLVLLNNHTAWIATHPTTPMLMQVGIMGGRREMERMMKGFAA